MGQLKRLESNGEPVEMAMRFAYCRNGRSYFGNGTASHLCSSQVQIDSDWDLPSSGDIQLCIKWPFLLQNACPIELVIEGTIDWDPRDGAVVSIRTYEFKLCGRQSFEQPMTKGIACNLIA